MLRITMNSVKIVYHAVVVLADRIVLLHAVRSAVTAIAELLVAYLS